jgi:SAM-dependent methyltransferase
VAPAEELATLAANEHLEALYTLLRIDCQRGDRKAAYETLEDLLGAGWWDHRRLREDPDLALINREDRAKAMIRRAWSRQYIRLLERDSRDAVQKPADVMATLAIRPGERVADIGAGSGYFTLRLAEAVGDGGHVWALDIRQEMLDYLAQRLREAQLENVEVRLVEPDDPELPAGGVDIILMVDTIHYIKDRTSYARKLRPALAPGGRLVIIDFRYDPDAVREFAPPLEQQVPRETLDAEMAAAGFAVVAAYDFLPEQYFVVYGVR